MNKQPLIKWSGSKRSQSEEIIKYFPKEINTYYEPFCGGCSILKALLDDNSFNIKNYVCSDINKDLIDVFNCVKSNPIKIYNYYQELWDEMNLLSSQVEKKIFFEKIRKKFNQNHNPLDFMFIMRTTTNGMPRYNKKGEFNNSFHITRNGINPSTLKKIIDEWHIALNKHNVNFYTQSFKEIKPQKGDFIYFDPPYANCKGMYYCQFDNANLWQFLSQVNVPYILSYDGISGTQNNTYQIPESLYNEHLYIKSGNSSFKRIMGKDRNAIVYESLYIRY